MMRLSLILVLLLTLTACSDQEDREEDQRLYGNDPAVAGKPTTTAAKPTTTQRYPNVAGHGILWKPVADSGGELVVLLNRSYGTPAVKVKDRYNRTIAVGTFVYYSNPDRATFRFSISGPEIARRYGTVYLIVGSRVFTVPDPSSRYE